MEQIEHWKYKRRKFYWNEKVLIIQIKIPHYESEKFNEKNINLNFCENYKF